MYRGAVVRLKASVEVVQLSGGTVTDMGGRICKVSVVAQTLWSAAFGLSDATGQVCCSHALLVSW